MSERKRANIATLRNGTHYCVKPSLLTQLTMFLNDVLPEKWVSRCGLIVWPPCSPDRVPIGPGPHWTTFLWWYVKLLFISQNYILWMNLRLQSPMQFM